MTRDLFGALKAAERHVEEFPYDERGWEEFHRLNHELAASRPVREGCRPQQLPNLEQAVQPSTEPCLAGVLMLELGLGFSDVARFQIDKDSIIGPDTHVKFVLDEVKRIRKEGLGEPLDEEGLRKYDAFLRRDVGLLLTSTNIHGFQAYEKKLDTGALLIVYGSGGGLVQMAVFDKLQEGDSPYHEMRRILFEKVGLTAVEERLLLKNKSAPCLPEAHNLQHAFGRPVDPDLCKHENYSFKVRLLPGHHPRVIEEDYTIFAKKFGDLTLLAAKSPDAPSRFMLLGKY